MGIISQEKIFHPKSRAIGFYGSQIRNFLDVNPVMPIDLYFPGDEPDFDVSTLIEKASRKQFVRCFKTDYSHGFMNKRSKGYDTAGYSEYLTMLRNEVDQFFQHV